MSWIITSDQVSPPGDAAITYGITNAGGVFNLRSTGTVDYEAEWGDGNVEISTLNVLPHTYTAGDYSVVVYSDGVYRPYFNNTTADVTQITSVAIGSGANLGTSLSNAWWGANNMTSFECPFGVTSSVTSFSRAWRNCNSLTSFPLLNTSSGTSFSETWRNCNSLTSFPLLNTSSGTNFNTAWQSCTSLTTFPANMFDTTGTLISSAFSGTWFGCALTAQSIENILVSLDTNGATGITLSIDGTNNAHTSTWSAAANAAWLSLDAKGWNINQNGPDPVATAITYGITNAGGVFNLRSTGTVDYAVDWDSTGGYEESTSNTLPHTYAAGDYDLVVYSDGVYRPFFVGNVADATQITSVAIGSGADLGTSLINAWNGASNMTTFTCPFDVTSSVVSFNAAWRDCNSLTSFPLLDTSSGRSFSFAWRGCNSLTSFPLLNTSSGVNFTAAWRGCNSLTSFPANMFDTTGTLNATAFNNAWLSCALTAQSIENILVSLDTNGATDITLGIDGGNNAPRYTGTSGTNLNWSAAAETAFNNLGTKGWTINYKDYDN